MRPVGCLVTAVVVLAGLAVVGDRVAEEVVEDRLADEAQNQLGTRPKVEIAGFPFVTQLVARRFGRVDVNAPAITERGVQVENVRLQFRGVDVVSRSQARVDTVAGTGVVSFASLENAARGTGIDLSPAGSELLARGTVRVFGHDVDVTAQGALSVAGGDTVVFSPSRFAAKDVPQEVTDALADAVGSSWDIRLKVNDLPQGVRLTGVRLVDNGVEVQLGARGLVLGG